MPRVFNVRKSLLHPLAVVTYQLITSYEDVREAALHLPKGDQARLLSVVAQEVADAYPGIEFQAGVCSGSARLIRTRIPVWLLESLRRQGATDATLLAAYPTINTEDLATPGPTPAPIAKIWTARSCPTETSHD